MANARFTRRERSERSVCNRLLGRAQRGPIVHRWTAHIEVRPTTLT